MSWYYRREYVPVARRQANALREVQRMKKSGRAITPVVIEGRKITRTFWGDSWCRNLEHYSDFASRLPRGRTYVCNGSVVDLQIGAGEITALVSGSELYEISINFKKLDQKIWQRIARDSAGQISSLVELLSGKLSASVMQIMTRPDEGLFPKPREISFRCSCPDFASMCKHIAATLYGVGARLDDQPQLLFTLRGVDHMELIAAADNVEQLVGTREQSAHETINATDIADVFGIELAVPVEPTLSSPPERKRKSVKKKKTTKRK